VAYAPGGATLATGSYDGTITLWRATGSGKLEPIGAPLADPFTSSFVSSVAFFRDGHTLAASGGRGTLLWNVTDPTRPARVGPSLTGHDDTVTTVAPWSPVASTTPPSSGMCPTRASLDGSDRHCPATG
jgi:WD40 repeat protein